LFPPLAASRKQRNPSDRKVSELPACKKDELDQEKRVLTHLLTSVIGAAIFLRMVAKEKNRRERHLLFRLAEQEKRLAEQEAAEQAESEAASAGSDEESTDDQPVVAKVTGQAA
jgi:hypothetical protein